MAIPRTEMTRLEDVCADSEKTAERFWAKVDRSGECWVWTASRMSTGYGRFKVEDPFVWQAHRFYALLTWGSLPAGALVLHHCDNRTCVRPDHLYAGTNADNNADMSARNRFNLNSLQGHANRQSKLVEADVREIRLWASRGESKASLGRRFGVSRQTASDIVARKLWGHLE